MNLSKKQKVLILYSVFFTHLCLGSLAAQPDITLFTPDSSINRTIANKQISEIDLIVYDETPAGLTIDPVLPAHWTWIAGKGQSGFGERIEFIFRDGHLYASSVEVCAFRNRTYPDIITDMIQANAYVIGLRKYDETLIFVATEDAGEVELVIDKIIFGEEKIFKFYLGTNESQLIRIFPKEPPYRP